MVGQMVVRMEVHLVVPMVGRSVDLMAVQMEVRLVVHLVVPQDLSEVRVALHRFAQLVPVPVQARLPVLQALVALGLEVVFA